MQTPKQPLSNEEKALRKQQRLEEKAKIMNSRFRIREEYCGSVSKPFSLFFCEKKVLWFWVPAFEPNRDEGEPLISFSSLQGAQRAIRDHCSDFTTYHYLTECND